MTKSISRKFIIAVIISLNILLIISSSTMAANDDIKQDNQARVSQIIIDYHGRSSKEIIRRVLPFKVGDIWNEEIKQLTIERLQAIDIFDPRNLEVSEKIETGNKNVKVTITLDDTSVYMVHPLRYGFKTVIYLLDRKAEQRFRDPFSIGLNPYVGVSRKDDDLYWHLGFDYPGGKGLIYYLDYVEFERENFYNQLKYQEDGTQFDIKIRYLPAANWKIDYSLMYHYNNYRAKYNLIEQEYLIPLISIENDKYGQFNMDFDYAYSLNSKQQNFSRVRFKWNQEIVLGSDKFLYTVYGGTASDETPLNYQFKGGGFSEIPLRGHPADIAAESYLTLSMEYQKELYRDWLRGFLFIDTARFISDYSRDSGSDSTITTDNSSEYEDWEIDGGFGFIIETPLCPLRFSAGYDNFEEEPFFNITIDESF